MKSNHIRRGAVMPHDNPPTLVATRDGMVALLIGRGDVEAGRVERLVQLVQEQLATIESAQQIVGRCRLMVDGYNDDARDVAQIQEVRAYFSQFSARCALLPFLLEHVKEEVSLYAVLAADARRIDLGLPAPTDPLLTANRAAFGKHAMKRLQDLLLAYVAALGQWLDQHGIAMDEAHPLYNAHERSCEAISEFLKDSEPLVM